MGDKDINPTIMGPIEKAECISVPYLEEGIEPILANNGCTFIYGEKAWNKYIMVNYPLGSQRQEVWPRTDGCRFLVTFPNKFEVLEVIDRNGVCRGLYLDPLTTKGDA